MFTGIISAIGQITEVTPYTRDIDQRAQSGFQLTVRARDFDLTDVQIGDSIAMNGACMTVVKKNEDHFWVDISAESLRCTVGLGQPGEVNLEKALRLSDRLGGHLVSGHVDGTGRIEVFEPAGESWQLGLRVPPNLARYLAPKGSLTVNGVSLTVNQVQDDYTGPLVWINLIPHTIQMTTLKSLVPGSLVNLEIDLIARYVERMLPAP